MSYNTVLTISPSHGQSFPSGPGYNLVFLQNTVCKTIMVHTHSHVVHIYIYIHTHICIYTYICIHTDMYVYTQTHYPHIYVCIIHMTARSHLYTHFLPCEWERRSPTAWWLSSVSSQLFLECPAALENDPVDVCPLVFTAWAIPSPRM